MGNASLRLGGRASFTNKRSSHAPPLLHTSSSLYDFQLCLLEAMLTHPDSLVLILQCLDKQEHIHLVHFISAVNEYEELFENSEDSELESLVEMEKFVRRIVDMYLVHQGEYLAAGAIGHGIVQLILEGEFDYLAIAKEEAYFALLDLPAIQQLLTGRKRGTQVVLRDAEGFAV
ncbi:hypothetical protein BASA81_000537 [Batrachochytrium salamandrivorans]|nr:hypothetical protein BASA81_000537 [Batrachochytrium salamandrivorans]